MLGFFVRTDAKKQLDKNLTKKVRADLAALTR
jgi:hypothetical protein